MDVEFDEKPLFTSNYEPNITTIPRKPREKYAPSENKIKRLWNYHNSIFRSWKQDTDVSHIYRKSLCLIWVEQNGAVL